MPVLPALLTAFLTLQAGAQPEAPLALYGRGQSFQQFIKGATHQRQLWLKNAAWSGIPPDLVDRLRRVGANMRLLIIAEDWCPDSVNTVPYVVKLAALTGVDARIVDRTIGQPLLARHLTPDGRTATPTVIVLREGNDVGAWVERPRPLQQLFLTMRTVPENGRRLAERQSWYDVDHGRTALSELVLLAEQTARRSKR